MKKQKNVGNALSRNEMRNVVAGLADAGGIENSAGGTCREGNCMLYIGTYSQWFAGTCAADYGSGSTRGTTPTCVCKVGDYQTTNGGGTCNA